MGVQKIVLSSRRQAWIYMYVQGKQDRICDPWALTFKALVLPLRSRRMQAKVSRSQTRKVRDYLHRSQAFCLVTCWPSAWALRLVFISRGNKTLNSVTWGGVSSGTAVSTSSVHSFLFSMIWGEPEVPWSEIAWPSRHLQSLAFTVTQQILLDGTLPTWSNVF